MTATRTSLLRFTGRIADLGAAGLRALVERDAGTLDCVAATVARIITDVRARGDAALRTLARDLDGVELEALEIPRRELRRAVDAVDRDVRCALERAAANIGWVHRAFAPRAQETSPAPGVIVGRRPDPLARVGVYAPGGRAVYPSSVLMAAIPARLAGVQEIVLASPPRDDGRPAQLVLAAAALAGVDRVFALGGAGAIAAMALGTESVPRVDRVVGPGNAYVAAAKIALSAEVGIDCAAGPSELLVIADASADAASIAGEMLAQAEHDPMARVVTLALDEALACDIERELAARVAVSARGDVIRLALASSGAVLVASDPAEALAFAAEYAPEHLLLCVQDPESTLACVRNAGTVFLGVTSSVAFGDYVTGANHVLPTGGTARWSSGLSPLDFVRWTTYQRIDASAAAALAPDVALLARAEQLPGHAEAALRAGGLS